MIKFIPTMSILPLLVLGAWTPSTAFAAETVAKATSPTQEMADPMKAIEKAAAVTPFHKELGKRVGTWTTTSKMWMTPDAKPTEATGKAVITAIHGGRFIQEKYSGDFMGKPFKGMGLLGYDNLKNKFVANWTDTMSTGIMTMEGTSEDNGKTIKTEGSAMCPMTGKEKSFRSVSTMKGTGTMVLESMTTDDNGKEFKSMEIVYTRE